MTRLIVAIAAGIPVAAAGADATQSLLNLVPAGPVGPVGNATLYTYCGS